jgi:hypothetical protein
VSFTRYATGVLLIGATVFLGTSLTSWDPTVRLSVFLGGLLAMFNALAAFYLITWSAARSTQTFMKAVLGGMLVRMALLLAAVTFAAMHLPALPLLASLMGLFAIYLVLELMAVQNLPQLSKKRAAC